MRSPSQSRGVAPVRGGDAEEAACRHLEALGYRIVARNVRFRNGEIDIVARDGPVTVFVEVRHRTGSTRGAASDTVNWSKRRRIIAAARQYAAQHDLSESPIRFDVIALDGPDGSARLAHHQGAFDSEGK